jgi:hypothetical protein
MKREDRLNRVAELTSRLLDLGLAAEERDELNELLRGDPESCERYLDLVEIHAHFVQEQSGESNSKGDAEILPFSVRSVPGGKMKSPRISKWWPALAAAAAVTLLIHGSLFWKSHLDAGRNREPSNAPGVAVLSRLVDGVWADPDLALEEGASVPAGLFRMKSGLAQLEFFSGATLIVEGPVELDLESEWRIACHEGRLRAFVPEPAQGFTIVTPEYHAVDLGTEFALSVTEDGRSEVHVVEGEVRLDEKDGAAIRTLVSGRGVKARDGVFENVDGGGLDFVDRRQLLHLANADSRDRYREWLKTRNTLAGDPDTLVFFDFESQEPWDRQLINQHSGGPKGAIIGAQWTEGRWPGKGALEFKRITDRTRIHIPGEFEALTFAAWVRIEGFDRWLSSLFLTDGFDMGEAHWQISNQGELVLGLSNKGNPNSTSPPVIHPGDLGKWLHLAVTIDRASGRVTHYRDGEIVSEDVRGPLPPLKLGNAEIGNWQAQGKPYPIRSLNGRIDEFVILQRILLPEEVASIYRAGMPNG